MLDNLFGTLGSNIGGVGVSCAREGEEARFDQGFP